MSPIISKSHDDSEMIAISGDNGSCRMARGCCTLLGYAFWDRRPSRPQEPARINPQEQQLFGQH
jgi:hypothetical protein